MLTRRTVTIAAAAAALGASRARAQSGGAGTTGPAGWPSKPVRWIVNFPPAGAADILSRTLAEHYGNRLGQPIVVDNKPGAGGLLGADIVAKGRGDQHLVMMSSAASHGIGPVLYKDVPYDPLADFTHIHLVGTFPTVLAVKAESPITSLADLVAMAKARPGEISYGSGGNGTMNHLTGQVLARAAGIQLTHVPYRGSAPAMNDLLGGQIVALMESLPTAIGYFTSGRMRPLAVSEAVRSPSLPDVPTFEQAGVNVVTTNWFGFSAPAGLPPELATRWQAEIANALRSVRVEEAFGRIGVRPGTLDSAGYTALIKAELARWKAVIAAASIKAD